MYIQSARFSPPRNPVLRLLLGLLGLALLALFSVVGLFIAATVAVVFAGRSLWLRWRGNGQPGTGTSRPDSSTRADRVAPGDVIDGEFTVIEQHDRDPR